MYNEETTEADCITLEVTAITRVKQITMSLTKCANYKTAVMEIKANHFNQNLVLLQLE